MGTLEKVMQMRQQGNSDSQIIDFLRQQGVSPKEINEALSQFQVKKELNSQQPYNGIPAISEIPHQIVPEAQMQRSMMQPLPPEENQEEMQEELPSREIQQSMRMQTIPSSYQPVSMPISQAQEPYPQNQFSEGEENSAEQPYYPEEANYQYPQYTPAGDIETINEIAEQIAEEKISKVKKEINEFARFREEIAMDVEKMNLRLTKIENTLNEFQASILGEIGGYGRDIQDIAKEMRTTQDSFSKILNPLTDNIRELEKTNKKNKKIEEQKNREINQRFQPKTPPLPLKGPSGEGEEGEEEPQADGFGDYLR